MLQLQPTTQFKRDRKRAIKRGLPIDKLDEAIEIIQTEQLLDPKYCDHALAGNYIGFRECHIQPDWLLIYAINGKNLILIVSRTGTHSDLFD